MHNLAERLLTSLPVELNSMQQLNTQKSQNLEVPLLKTLCQIKCITFLTLILSKLPPLNLTAVVELSCFKVALHLMR